MSRQESVRKRIDNLEKLVRQVAQEQAATSGLLGAVINTLDQEHKVRLSDLMTSRLKNLDES